MLRLPLLQSSGHTLARFLVLSSVFLPATTVSMAEDRPEDRARRPDSGFAIVGVHVIPMDEDRVLENQTVVVLDGRITEVGAVDATPVPEGLRRIEGEGRYLMPGLADLHVHLRRPDEYPNYLAWGVTTVMHLGGSERQGRALLEHRRQIAAGEMSGPNIYATERIFDGDPRVAGGAYSFAEPDAARARVSELAAAGFDFIKIYNNVSHEVFRAIVDESHDHGLPVFGHVPRGFDPLTAMREGQDAVVHTEEFFFTYFQGPRSITDMDRSYRPDLSKIPALARTLVDHEVAVIPDLSFTFTNLLMWDDLDHLWNDPEMRYLYPEAVSGWKRSNINRRNEIENFIVRGQWKYELMQELTRQFQEAGVLQVIGTDAALPGLFPGKAAHRELTELVKAGLGNFEALSMGTRNAGEFVRRYIDAEARFGRIEPGYRADLMLVAENPLEDVRHARSPSAVAVSGHWIERAELHAQREALAGRYRELDDLNREVDAALSGTEPAERLQPLLAAHRGDEEAEAAIEGRINTAGYAAASGDDLARAQALLEVATELFPQSANTWDSLGEILLARGDRNGAIACYRKALEVDPEFSNATYQLERILESVEE